jgi:anti-repressor protein
MSEIDLFASAGDGLDPSHFGIADDGRAYVVAGPFAKAMGYAQTKNALDQLAAEEKGFAVAETPGGSQRVAVIYEDGIWELIFRSTLPSAKTLKSRVKVILRQLRETGLVDTRQTSALPSVRQLAQMVLDAEDRADAANQRADQLEPAAASWEQLSEATGDYSVREAALILNRDPAISTGQKRLFAYLRDAGWIGTGGLPYQSQIETGRLAVRAGSYENKATSETVTTRQARVTVKGLHELHKRLGGAGPLLLSA